MTTTLQAHHAAHVTTSTVDAIVTDLAHSVLGGDLDESDGRSQILSCLTGSSAVDSMVQLYQRQVSTASASVSDAIRSECEKRLGTKVLAVDGSGVQLRRLVTASATGWAERFLKSGASWIFSNAVRTVQEDATDPHTMSRDGTWSTHSVLNLAEVHRDVYVWMEKTQGTKHNKLRQARSAVALRMAYRLPEVIRPHYSIRHRVLAKLNDDALSVQQAARQQLRAVTGTPVSPQHRDDDLMSLWDDYSPDQLHTMLSGDCRAAQWIALAGCCDYLRPAQRDIKAFTGRVMKAAGRTTVSDRRIIRQAIAAYIETEFSIEQLRGAAHKLSKQQRLDQQHRYRMHTRQLLQAAASLHTDLGVTADAVFYRLEQLAAPMIHELHLVDQFHDFHTQEP